MILTHVLWTWIFLAVPATADLEAPSPPTTHPHHPQSMTLTRLERLETLLADHQAQYRHDRDTWGKENRMLRKNLRRLQGDVLALQREKREMRKEIGALQNAHALSHTLAAENQALKSQMDHHQNTWELYQILPAENQALKSQMDNLQNTRELYQILTAENQALKSQMDHLQRLLVSTDIHDQSSVSAGSKSPGQQSGQSGQSGQAVNTSQPAGSGQQDDDPSPGIQRTSDPAPVRRWNRSGHSRQHVQSARSDDQGPLQVVVDHLAATTNQLTSDLQAMHAQHSSDVQEMKTQLTTDVQALNTHLSRDVHTLRSQITALQAAQGSTFVQWGSSTCSGTSELVYSGAVGGSFYNDPGAAANLLCLTLSPTLLVKTTPGFTVLYGAEYETGDAHQDINAVCAVCRAHQPTTIMVPGTNVCATGWNLMYSGYLMAGAEDEKGSTEYICVDSKLEGEMGSNHNDDGHHLYFTRTRCGSLPCPAYENDKVVTCAVCSK